MPHIIYQAGPLFNEAEQTFQRELSTRLRQAGHTVIWPGDLLTDEQLKTAGPHAPHLIFSTCRAGIDHCTAVVALLDGHQVDDGTAWEVGYAYAKGTPVYGLRTDVRNVGETPFSHVNSMIEDGLAGLADNMSDLMAMLAPKIEDINELVREVVKRGF